MVYAAFHRRLSALPWTLGVRVWAFDNRGIGASRTLHGR
jgi:predicted alpha/beta hydrolase